jgi:hypothetical protein
MGNLTSSWARPELWDWIFDTDGLTFRYNVLVPWLNELNNSQEQQATINHVAWSGIKVWSTTVIGQWHLHLSLQQPMVSIGSDMELERQSSNGNGSRQFTKLWNGATICPYDSIIDKLKAANDRNMELHWMESATITKQWIGMAPRVNSTGTSPWSPFVDMLLNFLHSFRFPMEAIWFYEPMNSSGWIQSYKSYILKYGETPLAVELELNLDVDHSVYGAMIGLIRCRTIDPLNTK